MISNKIAFFVLFCLCINIIACTTKNNPIDNSSTIKVPYVLYAGTRLGKIVKTNDGINFDLLHKGGGGFTNSLWALDSNIVWINKYVQVGCGTRNIEKFSFKTVPSNVVEPIQKNAIGGFTIEQGFPNAACYDANKKIFYVCQLTNLLTTNNGFGHVDSFKLATINNSTQPAKSVVKTSNGNIYYYSFGGGKLYLRNNGIGAFDVVTYTTNNATKPPSASSQDLFLSSFNNRLILSDADTISGSAYSDDGGVNWYKVGNVPAKAKFLMGKQIAYDGGYYTSIDGAGLYKLVGNDLQKVGAGLPNNIRIWDIVAKRIVYRTDVARYYYYLGTNKGTYKSEDGMKNWVKLNDEEFTSLY